MYLPIIEMIFFIFLHNTKAKSGESLIVLIVLLEYFKHNLVTVWRETLACWSMSINLPKIFHFKIKANPRVVHSLEVLFSNTFS